MKSHQQLRRQGLPWQEQVIMWWQDDFTQSPLVQDAYLVIAVAVMGFALAVGIWPEKILSWINN